MTNEQIIQNYQFELMEAGLLKGTGKFIKVTMIEKNGDRIEKLIELPEEIHTYNGWKERGFQVKKGEKSTIKFKIWKHVTTQKASDDPEKEPEETSKMFQKLSAFFTASQVEPLTR